MVQLMRGHFRRAGNIACTTEAINGWVEHLPGVAPRDPQSRPLHCEVLTRIQWRQSVSTLSFTMSHFSSREVNQMFQHPVN